MRIKIFVPLTITHNYTENPKCHDKRVRSLNEILSIFRAFLNFKTMMSRFCATNRVLPLLTRPTTSAVQ